MLDQRNLELLLQSHFPIVVVETHEEQRAVQLLQALVAKHGTRLLLWTATEGLKDHLLGESHSSAEGWTIDDLGAKQDDRALEPEQTLEVIRKETKRSIVVLLDFHPYLSNPRIVRSLKEIAQDRPLSGNTLVLISHRIDIPPEIRRLCARFELALPDSGQIRQLVLDEAKVWSMKNQKKLKVDRKALDLLVRNLQGLTTSDARRLVRNAIYDDGAVSHSDIDEVMRAKYELVDQKGVLSYEYDTVGFRDVGGFDGLKKWLHKRKKPFVDTTGRITVDVPRGILLIGVQGCGKSLAARSVAGSWGVPLLRLDLGAIYNKYIGETEKNIRETLKSAEVLAPCVLWVDEIEKGIESNETDGGTSARVLGTLLTWMAEKRAHVFIVATANDISKLPPELLRKGRLDEIFFVDLPSLEARIAILTVHLKKRRMDPRKFDLARIAGASEGFSGAELEQALVSAHYTALANDEDITTEHVLTELAQTRPLSVVMAERVQALRHWAKDRTVHAD
jgi:SpoVK/Ycf46/Vps4 family AAA+-type ATPase